MTSGKLEDLRSGSFDGRLERGFDFLRRFDAATIGEGRHELGEGLYAMVERYVTHGPDEKKFEAHRRYNDIQFVAEGKERIDLADVATVTPQGLFDDAKDVCFYDDPVACQSLFLDAGSYAVFYPADAHKPGLFYGASGEPALKVVVKVPVS